MSSGRSGRADSGQDETAATEFGGPLGVVIIITLSHVVVLGLWVCWRYYGGAIPSPGRDEDLMSFGARVAGQISEGAAPTWAAFALYWGFLGAQAVFAVVFPGPRVLGLPLPHEANRQLEYRANGVWAWYATLVGVASLHFSGLVPLHEVGAQFGALMTVSMISSNAIALGVFAAAHARGRTHRMSGRPVYDFFMGAVLNPRIGVLDLKMWAEIRVSWMLLFLLTSSAAAMQFHQYGTLSTPMIFMLLAHWLYANACMKGEECIPTTWDIFHEKWGWMLIFWNFTGVPFVYACNSWYLASRPPFEHSVAYTIGCFALLLGAYYVWDTAQSQRNRFRMMERGTFVPRRAFPQLPWGTLVRPRTLTTARGSKLLIDGWWRYARKIHYTADVAMGLSWGLICGFDHALPFFYVTFFVVMIGHRARRDARRCRAKYGADWDRYVERVPYQFVPGII